MNFSFPPSFLMTTASIRSPFAALSTQSLSAHSNIQASSALRPALSSALRRWFSHVPGHVIFQLLVQL